MVRQHRIHYFFLFILFIFILLNEITIGTIRNCHLCKASQITKINEDLIKEVGENKYKPGTIEYYFCICVSIILVTLGGIASGLTTGLMSLDSVQLRVLIEAGNENEKKWASTAFNLIQRHHLLLVTLLLTNSLCMEALPLFLDRIIPSWVAVILSVTAILIFGEILPQAICTGRHQLRIAANCANFVKCLTFCLFLFSWPISKILDYFIGDKDRNNNFYARGQLKALIALHRRTNDLQNTPISLLSIVPNIMQDKSNNRLFLEEKSLKDKGVDQTVISMSYKFTEPKSKLLRFPSLINKETEFMLSTPSKLLTENNSKLFGIENNGLANDEVTIIQGVLDMANKSLLELSVPLEKVYMLHIDSKLDHLLLEDILRVGHSRIPIFSENRHHIKGLLLVKSLITIDPDDSITIKSLFNSKACNRYIIEPIFTSPETNPYDALNMFQQGRCHVAILTNYVEEYRYSAKTNTPLPEECEIIGIATLEDIIEEIIQEEIIDEFDANQHNVHEKIHNYPCEQNILRRSSSFFKFNQKSIQDYFKFGYQTKKNKCYKEQFVSAPDLWSPIYYSK